MSQKVAKRKTATTNVEAPVAPVPTKTAPAKKATEPATPAPAKKATKKAPAKASPVPESVVEPVAPSEPVPVAEGEVGGAKRVSRKKKAEQQSIKFLADAQEYIKEKLTEYKDNAVLKDLKKIQHNITKAQNSVEKITKTKERTQPSNRPPSGFQKPVGISKEIASFAGWDAQEPKSRTDVTNMLCAYVKKNSLGDPNDGRVIHPDAKLRQLLGISPEDRETLTYAGMQKRLKGHFFKMDAPVEA